MHNGNGGRASVEDGGSASVEKVARRLRLRRVRAELGPSECELWLS